MGTGAKQAPSSGTNTQPVPKFTPSPHEPNSLPRCFHLMPGTRVPEAPLPSRTWVGRVQGRTRGCPLELPLLELSVASVLCPPHPSCSSSLQSHRPLCALVNERFQNLHLWVPRKVAYLAGLPPFSGARLLGRRNQGSPPQTAVG